MDSFTKMLNAQLILLVYMAVGMYCMKIHLIDQETKKKLVDLILKITLPCMIFNSFNKPLTPQILVQTAMILAVAFCISILSYLLGKVIYNRYPQDKKSILQYCTLVNNSGFLGIWGRRIVCSVHFHHPEPYLHVDRRTCRVHHRRL